MDIAAAGAGEATAAALLPPAVDLSASTAAAASGSASVPTAASGSLRSLSSSLSDIGREWAVIKINTRGRRQSRLLGIDAVRGGRITNRKVEKQRLFGSDKPRRSERLLADVLRVEVPNREGAGNTFAIAFRDRPDGDGGDEDEDAGAAARASALAGDALPVVVLRYETRTASERTELLAALAAALDAVGLAGRIVYAA